MSNSTGQVEPRQTMARDEKIDILRFIGLAMIILAHTDPSPLIAQIRNFDVPLMVLVSGASFALSYRYEAFTSYLWKRIKRLVFPTWIFLTVYFAVIFATNFPIVAPGIKTVIGSYILLSGIGYVWIIRVFLLVALVSPFILKFSNSTKSHATFFSVTAAIYIAYEIILFITKSFSESPIRTMFENTVLYVIPYAILFAIGLRLTQLSKQHMINFMMVAFAVCVTVGAILWNASGTLVLTQEFKYPPSIYYLSYALAVSLFLWLISDRIVTAVKQLGIYEPVMFIAQNTIWIYLWHIPLIEIINLEFYIKYPIVFALASCIAFVQIYLVKKVLIPRLSSQSNIRNVNYLLTG